MVKDKNTKNSKSTKASVNKGESKVTIITKSNINNSIKEISTIEELINRLRTLKKIIVITGAGIQHQFVLVNFIINSIVKGISVSCGIPDFRSKDVGIYNNLDCSSINIPSAELLFDLEYFCMGIQNNTILIFYLQY